MENPANNSSFWQFSDNLRLQANSLANLSLNDSIWSANHAAPKRRNFDFRNDVVSDLVSLKPPSSDHLNSTDPWKLPNNEAFDANYSLFGAGLNGGFNKGVYGSQSLGLGNQSFDLNSSIYGGNHKGKSFLNGVIVNGKKNDDEHSPLHGGKNGIKKNKGGNKESGNNKNGNSNEQKAESKKFKTLPPEEALPRNETIGGYIFVCNNETMEENLKRQLFGLPPRYRDSVRSITPGLPLFLYNYSTHQLHGIFEAASFGGTNIDPMAWEDKKAPGESRFPAQVRVATRKIFEPLEEDSFRPILHHYDGPKFRLELNVPEALSLLDSFEEKSSS